MDTHAFFTLIDEQRRLREWSIADLSERAFSDRRSSAIADIKRGRSPRIETVSALAEALDLEFYIGPPKEPAEILVSGHERYELTAVPRYEVSASAGNGASVEAVGANDCLIFRKDWLRRHGISTTKAALLRARGDSMEPVIWDGDTLLIDTSRTMPQVRPKGRIVRRGYQEDVFVVEREGELRVKAVRRPDEDTLILVSENTHFYDPEVLKREEINELRIVGQVLWWGHVAN